ncbi:imelysin family protein [Pukyongiella litopenaei]|uniref:Imelysin family protein n=1 Tax=Pukyongiella litopenaei TaxID=2605946 RepID=A0A2S0MUC4_9RHOB|nr:imelysin family protein [Pukyongiella litopenaei]AVO39500.1 imelysin family protein [Pukyongiella litopenaei]
MRCRFTIFAATLCLCGPAAAETALSDTVALAVSDHVLPAVSAFEQGAGRLDDTARAGCGAGPDRLRAAFHATVDDWTRMSHLRFGPTEDEDRAFAIAFWPDSRGKTPKALAGLLSGDAALLEDADAFRQVSIAARGLYALEFLLFDEPTMTTGSAAARCLLVRAIARDVAANAVAIAGAWRGGYAADLTEPGEGRRYRSDTEAAQELFKALSTGLQFTADARLGRPLGGFDRPRPNRAELYRSGRSLRQVWLSLEATRDLALILAAGAPDLADRLDQAYAHALRQVDALADPSLAGVADPQGRLRIEALQQLVNDIRDLVTTELGPILGVAAGFNSLDGD